MYEKICNSYFDDRKSVPKIIANMIKMKKEQVIKDELVGLFPKIEMSPQEEQINKMSYNELSNFETFELCDSLKLVRCKDSKFWYIAFF